MSIIAYTTIKLKNKIFIMNQQPFLKKMNNEDSDNSLMFKVDESQKYQYQGNHQKLDHFFNKDKKILNDGQPRKVLFGPMQQQQKTIYQVIQPYLWKMAQATGQAATVAGKGIYAALYSGAQWVYDKLVNKVIPYTAQQIPKLLFIIKNQKNKQNSFQNSDSFHVLQIDENDYNTIQKDKKNKNKKRIIVPFDKNEDPQFVKMLENQNFKQDFSFKIGEDSDDDQQTFMVPSATFVMKYKQAVKKNTQNQPSQQFALQQYESQDVKVQPKKQTQNQNKEQTIEKKQEVIQKKQEVKNEQIKSLIYPEDLTYGGVQDYKKAKNKYIKLKDCYIFQLEGKNSVQYDFLDQIQKDDNTKCGYLIKSNRFTVQDQSSSGQFPGQAPLLTEQKKVDRERKVRVQIPTIQVIQNKKQEKQLQFA